MVMVMVMVIVTVAPVFTSFFVSLLALFLTMLVPIMIRMIIIVMFLPSLAFCAIPFHALVFATFKIFMMRMVVRHVYISIPAILYKVYRPTAGIVATAVTAPVTRFFGSYAQVKGFDINSNGWWFNDDGFGSDQ
jgi:hypothetical protein